MIGDKYNLLTPFVQPLKEILIQHSTLPDLYAAIDEKFSRFDDEEDRDGLVHLQEKMAAACSMYGWCNAAHFFNIALAETVPIPNGFFDDIESGEVRGL